MKKIVLFFTLFLITLSNVAADQVTLLKNRIGSVYTYYYDTDLGRDRYLYANRYTFGDTTAYCLELGKAIDSNIYTYTTSFEEANINKEELDYIKLIAYYGYDYPGHNTEKYYMATQEIMWNKLTNSSINWVEDMNPSKILDISVEKQSIIDLVNTHYKKPSFDSEEIVFTLGQKLVLEDVNNVLNRYVTTSENVVIDGNKLILNENFNDEEIIFTKPNYTGNQFLLYTSGASQKMLSTGGINNVTSTVKVKIVGGSIEVNKLDKDTNSKIPQGEGILDGAIYELFDNNGSIVDTITIGTKNKISSLPLGVYTLKEKKASKGYLLDENIYNIEISKNKLDVKLNVYEEVIKRKVEIFKVFASNATGELIPEENITFNIYDKSGNLVDYIITDYDGYASVILPYGTYVFKQMNSTENYYKVDDFIITISEYDDRPIYKLLSDSEINARVKIIKKDLDTKENIIGSNIKFKIFSVNEGKYVSLNVSYPENKVTTEFEVDRNGIFITPVPLPPGKYILEEVKESMNGYLYNVEKVIFTIGASSNFVKDDDEVYLEIPFYNKRVKGEIKVIKYGEEVRYIDNSYYYKEIPLEGVNINLYAKEDIYENGKLIYKKDCLVKELVTDEEGIVEKKDLPLGKYYLKEVSTTNGHIIDDAIYDIDLVYKDENTATINQTIEIKNYLSKGKLVINKYETNTNTAIENTLIEICTKDNVVVYKGYTNKQGQIIIEDLPYGEYYLSEVESSSGYRLLEVQVDFEIDNDEEIIYIYNERIQVPNTGFTLNTIDIFVILCILLSIIIIILFPRERMSIFISIIIILLGVTYFVILVYKYYDDYRSNQRSVDAYINNEIDMIITEEKYQYKYILEIPKINLKRGILDINNEYNNSKYNIELIKEDENIIVLAAHNGSNLNSYFGKLHAIELGDEINFYKNGTLYEYIYSEKYDIKKNGYADIYRKDGIKSIVLITCKDNTDDAQTVYIGYLKEISTY